MSRMIVFGIQVILSSIVLYVISKGVRLSRDDQVIWVILPVIWAFVFAAFGGRR